MKDYDPEPDAWKDEKSASAAPTAKRGRPKGSHDCERS